MIRAIASQIVSATNVELSGDDESPAAFGGTPGKGEWGDMQYFFTHPSDITGTEQKLEADASKAYGH